jgi:hypothetical protein
MDRALPPATLMSALVEPQETFTGQPSLGPGLGRMLGVVGKPERAGGLARVAESSTRTGFHWGFLTWYPGQPGPVA